MQRARMAGLSVLITMAALATGCSGGGSDDADQGASGGAEVATGDAASLQVAAQQGDPADGPRRVVYTSDLRVRVDTPVRAAREAIEIAETAGGELSSQSESVDDDRVRVTVRVPSEQFRSVLGDIAALGEVLERQADAEDVTDEVVDLEGRLANAEASAQRLRELFADAQDVEQVVSIENALTQREAEVESLTGQLQLLEDRADRSTITASFTREGEPKVDDDIPGFADGLRRGWVTFLNVLAVAVTALGFLLPFLAVVIPILLLTRLVLRRVRRRRSPSPLTATAPAAPPAPPPSSG